MNRGGVLRLPEEATRNARGVSGPGYMPGPRRNDRRRANGPSNLLEISLATSAWSRRRPGYKRVIALLRQPLCVNDPSEAEGPAVGPGVRASAEAPRLRRDPDALSVAEEVVPFLGDLDLVASCGQLPRQVGRITPLEVEAPGWRPPRAAIEPAGRLRAALGPEPALKPAGDERGLRLGLALAPHGPVDEARPAPVEIHGRDQRVHGALAGGERVGLGGIEREEGAPILEDDARVTRHEPRAPGEIERLDQRDRVAFPVGGDDGDRVSRGGGSAGRRQSAVEGDAPAELRQAVHVE